MADRCRLYVLPVLLVLWFRHIGEAGHDLGYLLPFVLAGDKERIEILAYESHDITLAAVTTEEGLCRLVARIAHDDGVTAVCTVTQHQFDILAHPGLAIETVAESIGNVIDSDTGFQVFEIHFVISHNGVIRLKNETSLSTCLFRLSRTHNVFGPSLREKRPCPSCR